MLGRYLDLGNPVAKHPLNDGLLAWWLGLPNNSGGKTLFDLTGRRQNLALSSHSWGFGPGGIPTVTRTGGSNAGGIATPPGVTGAFSVSYLTREGTGGAAAIALGTSGSYGGPFNSSGIRYWVDGSASAVVSFADTFDGNWHRHLWAFDNSGTTSVAYRYLRDGVVVSSGTTGGTTLPTPSQFYLCGGTASFGWSYPIGDVRLWNRGLSASEGWADYDQWLRGHPDTLRRWSRKATVFGGVASAAGGNRRRRVILCGGR